MGTSFTQYRGCGFWTRDAALETVLALLVREVEPLARQDPDLDPILDTWTVQSVAGFGGCVSAGLDEHLTSQPGLPDVVTAALARIRDRLPAGGSIEVTSPDLARRAGRVCAGHSWSTPGALATWAGNVADAMHDLVAGRLPQTPSGSSTETDGTPAPSSVPEYSLARPYGARTARTSTCRSAARGPQAMCRAQPRQSGRACGAKRQAMRGRLN